MTENMDRINALFNELVPGAGKAESLAGELIRATARIGYRFFNDGDQIGIGYGKETCNPAWRFLRANGDRDISLFADKMYGLYSETAYEKNLDILCGMVADYVESTPELRQTPTDDMWDYRDEDEDVDDWEEEEEWEDECDDEEYED
jgi:hypothetical protein